MGIDFDGILFDSINIFLNLFNEYTGERYTINDITDWNLHKTLPQKYSKLIDNLWFDKELWHRVQPLRDSQQYVKRLVDDKNIEVFVVTDTHPKLANIKTQLLNKKYPFINTRDNLFICKNKQMLNLDILFDDNINNLINGKYHKLLMNYPYNKFFNCDKDTIIRINNWSEAYNEIQRILESKKVI